MFIISFILAYLLGSIPFGVIFARMKGINLLEMGSRNTGATNAFRCAGPVVGIATALFDILKGLVAVWLADLLLEPNWFVYLTGVFAIIGHTKSIFLGLRGGKAIATSFGVFLYINTIPILLTVVVWAVTLLIFRMVSLASIMGGIVFPIITFFYTNDRIILAVSIGVAAYAIWRHRENIKRIMNGTESKIGQSKRNLK